MALSTRPDITYAVAQVAKFCEVPDATHWEAIKHIFAYLIATTDLGIWIGGDQTNAITGYSDADYARDIDVRYHFIRKADEGKKISVEFVRSADQLADIFTKPLSRVKFEEMRSRIGVGSVSD